MSDRYALARMLLERHFGFTAFRPLQARVVYSVLRGRDVLGVLPTGGGKSVCFQIPAMALGGYTLVISPLISLMQDQVAAARARGLPAASLAGPMSPGEIAAVLDSVAGGGVRLLYTSPERLQRLTDELRRRALLPILLAVDEAHCIAEWGDDFRPSYRKLRSMRERLGRPPVVALTGSATPAVRDDIAAALGLGRASSDFDLHLGSFDRRNLRFGVRSVSSERERLAALLDLLRTDDCMSIVYAPTRKSTEAIASALRKAGHRAAAYHAGLNRGVRQERLEGFLTDELDVIVATSAFGMGIDKPTVRLVVHWSMPPTPESYYQEAGRAGRDGALARCVLLYRPGDAVVHRRQLDVTFPPRRTVEGLWSGRIPAARVPTAVRDAAERFRRELRPERAPPDWRPVELRRRKAAERIDAVERYAKARGCRRAELLRYFGEEAGECSGCDGCRRTIPAPSVNSAAVHRLAQLRRALARVGAPWPGALLEGDTLVRLALRAPSTAEELAVVPGVGPVLAARHGALLLKALGTLDAAAGIGADQPAGDGVEAVTEPAAEAEPLASLIAWRAETACGLAAAPYELLSDPVLRALARERPNTADAVARVAGLGPRMRAKYAAALAEILK